MKDALDIDGMRRVARALVGLRDFRSFAESDARDDPEERGRTTSTHVLVERVDLIEDGDTDFLVLQLVQGRNLGKAIREGLSPAARMKIAAKTTIHRKR